MPVLCLLLCFFFWRYYRGSVTVLLAGRGQFHFVRTRLLKQCRVYSLKTKATPYQRRQGLRFDLRLSPRGSQNTFKNNLTPVDTLLPCSASLPLETVSASLLENP